MSLTPKELVQRVGGLGLREETLMIEEHEGAAVARDVITIWDRRLGDDGEYEDDDEDDEYSDDDEEDEEDADEFGTVDAFGRRLIGDDLLIDAIAGKTTYVI